MQAALSMSLVWSNTAFGDEALYLWEGKQEWAHWLHGAPLESFHNSGAPQIYPPLGALASDIGGVPAARLLSLVFMLAATALVYSIGVRLFGRRTAIAGAALWAVSEPVLRLAFATYDPLGCLLIICGAYLAIRTPAILERRSLLLALASATMLSLAAVTAVSFTIMIPAVVAISFFAWADRSDWRTALRLAGVQVLSAIALMVIGITVLGQWHNLVSTTVSRNQGLGQGLAAIVGAAWGWDGLMLCLAAVGAILAITNHGLRASSLLVVSCALAAVLVPVYQAYIGTGYSMDKHMSAGSAFAALAAGYAISHVRVRLTFPAAASAALAAALLAFPAINGVVTSRTIFHSWANVSALMSSAQQFEGKAPALVDSGDGHLNVSLLRYYLPGGDWRSTGPRSAFAIDHGRFSGIIVDLGVSSAESARIVQASRSPAALAAQLTSLAGKRSVAALAEASHRYALVAVIPYQTTNGQNGTGVFIVWRVTPPPHRVATHRHVRKPATKSRRRTATTRPAG